MAKVSWHLNSSSGRDSVSWDAVADLPRAQPEVVLCDIQLAGEYYGAALADSASGLRDYSLTLRGMAVGMRELQRMCSTIESWLDLSLAEQARQRLGLDCSVGGLFDQSLVLSLGSRDDIISGGKPVATFKYLVGSMRGELVFVTDQSCLRELTTGIRAALGELAT